tara:strand:+ start:831 stop:1133 length:303 start_codon:yes stop_codon:yes gene_type:complete
MEHIINCFKNYANFDGRARRKEYWFFVLFTFICLNVLSLINETLYLIGFLGLLLPSINVASRRMHDIGESGWMQLVPFYGLYLLCKDSEPSDNKYGPKVK